MSVLFTDSDCELDYKDIEKYNIELIKMPYTLDGEEYYYDDGKDPSFVKIYDRMRNGAVPITSALSPQNYIDYFEPFCKKGEDILYVAFSDQLSGTFNYMNMALAELKEKYPERKLTLFNTKNICFGGGIQALHAAKLKQAGKSDEEIVAELEKLRDKVRVYFYVDSLAYLKRGGRISSASAVFGTMLGIKPILKCDENGKIVKVETVHGSKKAMMSLAAKFMAEAKLDKEIDYYIVDADNSADADALLKDLVIKSGGKVNIVRNKVGPVITAHCGPGTVGLIYIAK